MILQTSCEGALIGYVNAVASMACQFPNLNSANVGAEAIKEEVVSHYERQLGALQSVIGDAAAFPSIAQDLESYWRAIEEVRGTTADPSDPKFLRTLSGLIVFADTRANCADWVQRERDDGEVIAPQVQAQEYLLMIASLSAGSRGTPEAKKTVEHWSQDEIKSQAWRREDYRVDRGFRRHMSACGECFAAYALLRSFYEMAEGIQEDSMEAAQHLLRGVNLLVGDV